MFSREVMTKMEPIKTKMFKNILKYSILNLVEMYPKNKFIKSPMPLVIWNVRLRKSLASFSDLPYALKVSLTT
jgi:hypothetical protein